ncbi:MAG: hypothetical protein K1X85_02505 [Ignavibacteria bacterium]|nr:hypothetical protein [Ignavibacteria bacterium]
MEKNNGLIKFREVDHEKFFDALKNILDCKKAEDVVYTLICISEQIDKIYLKHIPLMIEHSKASNEKLIDIFEDIKFSCNEICQLVETSKLTGLRYWDDDESN